MDDVICMGLLFVKARIDQLGVHVLMFPRVSLEWMSTGAIMILVFPCVSSSHQLLLCAPHANRFNEFVYIA